ncbi:MAG: hypothetical protein ACTSWY_11345, partial [Promethearchaeota archaeon]
NIWYNISLHLKLYLVYGQETNLLLSYNINYTIQETIWNNDTQSYNEVIDRKIIFWNVRRPTRLTQDYPVFEILELNINLPVLPIPGIGYIEYIICLVFLYVFIKVYRSAKKKKKSNTEKRDKPQGGAE